MPRKRLAMATIDIVQLIVTQRQRKQEILWQQHLRLYGSLKLLTHGQVTSQWFNSNNILSCVL